MSDEKRSGRGARSSAGRSPAAAAAAGSLSASSSSSGAAASASVSKPPRSPGPPPSHAAPEAYHGTSQGGVGSKPSTMWTAPQSLLSPSVPPRRKPFDPRRAEVYFRRVARPDMPMGPPPAMWQRYASVAAGVGSVLIGTYLMVWADFGEREHVFSGIRRALKLDAFNPLALSPEERLWINKRDAERAAAAPGATSSSER